MPVPARENDGHDLWIGRADRPDNFARRPSGVPNLSTTTAHYDRRLNLILCLSIPREQPLTQATKTEIGCEANDPDREDTGKDALSAKGLLRL